MVLALALGIPFPVEAQDADAGAPGASGAALAVVFTLASAPVLDAGTGPVVPTDSNPEEVGDVLASQLLGADDIQVIRPGSVQSLIAELKAIDPNGKIAPGVALEATPASLGAGTHFTWEDYRGKQLTQDQKSLVALGTGVPAFLVRTLSYFSVSAAAAQVQPTTTAISTANDVASAVAVRLRLWDDSDWRMNDAAITCGRAVAQDLLSKRPPPDAPSQNLITTAGLPPLTAADQARFKQCLDANTKWNAFQLALGGGAAFVSAGGDPHQTQPDKALGFASVGTGLGTDRLLLTASARYTYHFAESGLASRQVIGVAAKLAAKFDWIIVNVTAGGGADGTGGNWALDVPLGGGVQIKATDQGWIEANVVDELKSGGAPGQLVFLTGLKWNYDLTPKAVTTGS